MLHRVSHAQTLAPHVIFYGIEESGGHEFGLIHWCLTWHLTVLWVEGSLARCVYATRCSQLELPASIVDVGWPDIPTVNGSGPKRGARFWQGKDGGSCARGCKGDAVEIMWSFEDMIC